MSSVDERIVQMRFDNAQFESGVRQTLSSLDKLKQGLKFNAAINGANVLQNAFNGIKLGGINRSVDQLNRKFSSLGIAGMEIVKRVTNDVLNSVTRVATAIPNQIKAGGWARALNLENAQFQLKGLGVTWDKINNDIQYAVNGTAYGLDSAAKVAGQLAASNIEVSDSALTATKSVDDFSAACIGQTSAALKGNGQLDEMATALRSISGVAAMSNSSFEEIGQIYTRVAGQGRVFADDLNSIASRGLNASATLGKYLGKTEAEVRDMVSKGQIDFKTFSDAMYDAYADQAVKANNTFQGALSNTKSALSRIGADVADDLLPALTKILNSCRLLFNQVHKWIQPVLDSTGKLVSQIGDTLSPIIDAITAKIAKITGIAGGPIEQIAGFIDKITAKVKGVGNDILSYFGLDPETAKKAEDVAKSVDSTVTASVEHITEMAKRVIHGDFGNEPVRSENLEAIGENFEVIQNKVNELLGCSYRYKVQTDETTSSVNEQTDAIKQTTLSIEDQQKIMRRNTVMNFFKGFENIGKTISLVFTSLGSSIQSFFSTLTPPDWSKFSSDFAKATGVIVNNADRIKEVKQVIDDIVFSIGNTIEAISQVIGTLGKAIGDVVSKINFKPPTEFTSVIRKISDNLKLSQDSANGLHDIFVTLLSPLKLIVPLIQNISLFVLKMVEGATALNKKFLEFVGKSKILESVQKIFESIGDAIKKIFDGVKNSSGFQKFIDSIERFASIIGEKLGDAFEKFASWLEKISDVEFDGSKFDGIINAFSTFFDGLSTVIDTISDLIEGKTTIKDVLTKLGESIKEGLTILWDDIREGIRNIDFSQIGDDLKEGLSKIDLSSFNPKEMFSGIKDAIAGAFAGFSFKDAFSGIGKKISDGASEALKEEGTGDNGLDNGLENGLENGLSLGKGETVGEAIINALPKINLPSFSDIINGIGKVFDKIKDWLAPKIKDAIAAIKDAFKDFDFGKFINIIWKIFTNIEFGKIIKGVADFFSGIGDIIKNSGKVVKSVSTLISSIAGIPKQISGLIKDFRKSLKANVFKSFALGVLAIAGALMMISMIKVEKLGPSVLALGVIMAGLVAVVKYVNDMDIDTKKMSSFGKYAILMGVALLAISRAIKRIAGFDAKSLAGAVISLSAVIAVMTACLRKMGDSKINFGTAVGYAIAMSAVVSAVSRGLARLAKYDWKSLIAPAVAMSAVIFAVTKAISQLSKDGPSFGQSVGYAILLGVIVTSVSNALGNLAQYSWQSLTASAIALSGTVAAVIASTNLLNDNGGSFSQSVGYAILLGVIVGSVSSALENLAQYSWQSLTAAAIALSGTIAAIVLSTNLLNDNGVSFGQSVGYAILLGVIVTSVSNALSTLAQYSWESLTTAALALSGTIAAVIAAISLLSGGINIGTALVSAIAIGSVLGTVATIFGILLNVIPDPNSVLPVAEGMSVSLGAIVAALMVISTFGGGAGLITAAAELSTAIGIAGSIITGFIAAFGGLNMLTGGGLKEAIDQGGEILGAVGQAIGKLVSGFGLGVTSELPAIGSNLEAFGQSFANFASYAEQISGSEDSIKTMISTLTSLTGESFLDSLTKLFGGGVSNELEEVADALSSFCSKLSGVDIESINKLEDFSNAIEKVGKVDIGNFKSVVDTIGDISDPIQDISSLGSQMTTAATNITTFINSFSNFNTVDTTKLDQITQSIIRFSQDAVANLDASLSGSNVVSTVNKFINSIKSTMTSGLNAVAANASSAGKNIGSKFAAGLGSMQATARNKGAELGKAAIKGIKSVVGQAGPAGTSFGQKFATALQSSAGIARTAGLAVGQNASNGLNNASSYAYTSGAHFAQNFASGIMAGAGAAIAAAQSLASRIKNILGHTTPKEGPMKNDDVWGEHFAQNFANGIDKASGTVVESASNMANSVWDVVSKSNAQGKKSVDDLAKSISSTATNYLTKAKKTRDVTYTETLLYWDKLLDNAKQNSAALLEENGNVNDVIYKSAEQFISDHKEKIDEYVTDEEFLWKKVISLTEEGSDARQNAIRKYNDALVSDPENYISKMIKEYGEENVNQTEIWVKALKTASEDSENVFDTTKQKIKENLNSAIIKDADNNVTKYTKHLGCMAHETRTYYDEAIKKAKELGATEATLNILREKAGDAELSFAEEDLSRMKTYYDMSNTQQALYWKAMLSKVEKGTSAYSKIEEKFFSARNAAWNEYTNAVQSTISSLQSQLSLASEFKIEEPKFDIFTNQINIERGVEDYTSAMDELESRGILTSENLKKIRETFGVKDLGMINQLLNMSDDSLSSFNDSMTRTNELLESYAENVNQNLKSNFLYTDDEISEISVSAVHVMQAISDVAGDKQWVESVATSMKNIAVTSAKCASDESTQDYILLGHNLMDGTISGITERSPALASAVANAVDRAIEAGKAEAQVHSPSKKMMKIGSFMGEGLIIGMKDWVHSAGAMGKNLGNTALSGMDYMMAALASDISDNMDMQPVIRPVIDMSDVTSSANAIDSMLSSEQAMRVAAGYDSLMASRQNGSVSSVTNDNSVGSINVNIYPTENQNANDISDAVIKKLNNEIIRKRKVYA